MASELILERKKRTLMQPQQQEYAAWLQGQLQVIANFEYFISLSSQNTFNVIIPVCEKAIKIFKSIHRQSLKFVQSIYPNLILAPISNTLNESDFGSTPEEAKTILINLINELFFAYTSQILRNNRLGEGFTSRNKSGIFFLLTQVTEDISSVRPRRSFLSYFGFNKEEDASLTQPSTDEVYLQTTQEQIQSSSQGNLINKQNEEELGEQKKLEEEKRLAEQQRIAAEQTVLRKREEQRALENACAEEQRRLEEQRKLEEKKRLAKQQRIAAEQTALRKREEQRALENARAEEQRRLEEQRKLEEEKRLAEQQRIATEQAALRKREEQRALENARAEEQRRLEEQRKLEEESRLAEQQRIAAEQAVLRKLEEQRALENARAEEQRQLEEQRKLEEEKRLAEQHRIATEQAALRKREEQRTLEEIHQQTKLAEIELLAKQTQQILDNIGNQENNINAIIASVNAAFTNDKMLEHYKERLMQAYNKLKILLPHSINNLQLLLEYFNQLDLKKNSEQELKEKQKLYTQQLNEAQQKLKLTNKNLAGIDNIIAAAKLNAVNQAEHNHELPKRRSSQQPFSDAADSVRERVKTNLFSSSQSPAKAAKPQSQNQQSNVWSDFWISLWPFYNDHFRKKLPIARQKLENGRKKENLLDCDINVTTLELHNNAHLYAMGVAKIPYTNAHAYAHSKAAQQAHRKASDMATAFYNDLIVNRSHDDSQLLADNEYRRVFKVEYQSLYRQYYEEALVNDISDKREQKLAEMGILAPKFDFLHARNIQKLTDWCLTSNLHIRNDHLQDPYDRHLEAFDRRANFIINSQTIIAKKIKDTSDLVKMVNLLKMLLSGNPGNLPLFIKAKDPVTALKLQELLTSEGLTQVELRGISTLDTVYTKASNEVTSAIPVA